MKKYTTCITAEELRELEQRYENGDISNDEWSQMTPALRKHLTRYINRNIKSNK